jgi:hypothetical protein
MKKNSLSPNQAPDYQSYNKSRTMGIIRKDPHKAMISWKRPMIDASYMMDATANSDRYYDITNIAPRGVDPFHAIRTIIPIKDFRPPIFTRRELESFHTQPRDMFPLVTNRKEDSCESAHIDVQVKNFSQHIGYNMIPNVSYEAAPQFLMPEVSMTLNGALNKTKNIETGFIVKTGSDEIQIQPEVRYAYRFTPTNIHNSTIVARGQELIIPLNNFPATPGLVGVSHKNAGNKPGRILSSEGTSYTGSGAGAGKLVNLVPNLGSNIGRRGITPV